jgi:tetratricopeptide (TPR) repeat protein
VARRDSEGRALRWPVFFGLVLVLAGCGGGDGNDGGPPDTTPPQISVGPTAEAWDDSARIHWTTSEVANSVVRYGLTPAWGEEQTQAALVVNHDVLLTGLAVDTTYYYRVESTDAAANGPTTADGDPFVTEATVGRLLTLAWAAFASGDFASARTDFVRVQGKAPANAEGWNGGGWSSLRIGDRTAARSDLEQCLALSPNHRDAAAGLAFVLAALGEKEASAGRCLEVLGALGSSYVFAHDSTVNSTDLRVLLAQDYVHLQDFESALEQVKILDPAVTLDPGLPETWGESPTFEAALLSEIEALAWAAGT